MNNNKSTKAIITVVGRDTVGIIAKVSNVCLEYNVNILDITQSVIGEYFAMIMLADLSGMSAKFSELADTLSALGKESSLDIHTMHEDVFNTMHHI